MINTSLISLPASKTTPRTFSMKAITNFFIGGLLCFISFVHNSWALPVFQTTNGLGPDKWATVWLIRTFINPLPIQIIGDSAASSSAIQFDMPGAALDRTGSSTTYSAFLQHYDIKDAMAESLGAIVHDIEINAWNPNQEVHTQLVENAFRRMQLTMGRDTVSQTCYFEFFNRVVSRMAEGGLSIDTDIQALIPNTACNNDLYVSHSATQGGPVVPEMALDDVLQSIANRDRLVFLDTREPLEFREGHIPGAINMTLREINADSAQMLMNTDRVIAYCVKDFRGYEAARKLRALGVDAAIMNPYGIKGWHLAGLPVAGTTALAEYEAAEQLMRIAQDK